MKKVLFVLFMALVTGGLLFAGGGQEPQSPTVPSDVDQDVPAAPGVTDFESKWRDPQMPESWFSAPRTASEWGITSFNESPMLAERVARGELPPVEERLPADPPVIEPYQGVGQYGGQIVMFGVDFDKEFDFYGGGGAGLVEGLIHPLPNGQGYVPWFAEQVRFLENNTVIEITMRDGLKWSDGTPFVAGDEYPFHFETGLIREIIDPTTSTPPVIDVVRLSDNTVRLVLGTPSPTFTLSIANGWFQDPISSTQPLAPHHILRQNLPEFVGQDEARQRAQALGFNEVNQYILELAVQVHEQSDPRFGAPTMQAYVAVSRTDTELILERNPYYPFVDTDGNQLPYIDRLVVRFAAQRENIELQMLSGNADVLMSNASARNIPVYIQNEEAGDYRTLINLDASLTKPSYAFNFTPPEEAAAYGPYYRNVDFRRAMSLAINREQINERFYFGQGIPGQLTIAPMSPLFRPEWANAYAEYDPERARELLDEVGLVDRDGDGFRDFPDGSEFRIKMLYANASYLSDITIHEYVVSNWADVGIAVDITTVNEGVFWDRSAGNQFELKPHLIDISIPYPMGLVMLGIAPVIPPEVASFGDYSTWFLTDGEQGVRPPDDLMPELRQLFNDGRLFLDTLDDDALVRLLESQAENIWTIGTVGFTPVPVLIANKIQNVPERVLWDGALGREKLLMPAQWWIDEE